MKKTHLYMAMAVMALLPCHAAARVAADSLQWRARVGYSVGGTAPIGLPASIRSIDAFRPTPSVMVGIDARLPLTARWGVAAGLRLENKGMDTDVTTKGYRMELVKGDSRMEGLFTGHVGQRVTQLMLTLPVVATCDVGTRTRLKAGPYASLLMGRSFSGTASGGYLRQGDPTGAKIIIGDREGEWATYDFGNHMRRLQMGMAAGADWRLGRRVGLSAELSWGLTGLFSSRFKTVEQTLHPIYATVGLFCDLSSR